MFFGKARNLSERPTKLCASLWRTLGDEVWWQRGGRQEVLHGDSEQAPLPVRGRVRLARIDDTGRGKSAADAGLTRQDL